MRRKLLPNLGQKSLNQKFFDVPAGKRLVIRSVNGILYGPKDEKYKLIILSSDGGDDVWHPIAITGESFYDPEAKANAKIFSVATYFNARPNDTHRAYTVSLVRNSVKFDHPTFVKIGISGYLVDDPYVARGQ